MISLNHIEQLPVRVRRTIPADYLDDMGHMNVQFYMALFSDATSRMFEACGMGRQVVRKHQRGAFALQHFIQYRSEIHAGEVVSVRIRLLGRTSRKLHMMDYLVNESRGEVAATLEALGAHADLETRKITACPPQMEEGLQAFLEQCRALDWESQTCGCIRL
ncbi:MAG TPA: thioesterase family protein [Acidobacteriota bacterium]|nr:thioesterase family protein [Acidobacteriota bacterium]